MIAGSVVFSEEVFETILTRLAEGEGLVKICRDDDMPTRTAFYKWINADRDLERRYVQAREDQADTLADEIVHIADTCKDPKKARLQIDARKWNAAKLRPKKYGERLDLNHSGNLTVQVQDSFDDPPHSE